MKHNFKSCPFCGSQPELVHIGIGAGSTVRCVNKNCKVKPCTMASSNEAECVKQWNKRAE